MEEDSNEDKTTVPIILYDAWISTLLAQEAHNANHDEIVGTLLSEAEPG